MKAWPPNSRLPQTGLLPEAHRQRRPQRWSGLPISPIVHPAAAVCSCGLPRSKIEHGRAEVAVRHLSEAKPLELAQSERARLTLWLEALNEDSWSGAERVAAYAEIANKMTDVNGPALALRSLRTVAIGCWWGNPTQETRDLVVSAAERIQAAQELARFGRVETLQPPYHLFRREIEDEILPYCRRHDVGVLVYGPLAHGLLTGTLNAHTAFADDDWRRTSSVFTGDTYRRNLATVRALEKFAADRGITVSQLAIAWTLANPAVHVAIVGTRHAGHVDDSLAAAEVSLSDGDLAEIDMIMASATPVAGPSPEGM
jgi:hypothetical protein